MGYSIATPIKSEKAKKEMMAFLKLHYNQTLDTYARGPLIDRDLSYDNGPCRIGFDATTTSDYMISVCAWIALKVGKTKCYPTKATPKAAGPHEYIRYDGFQDWPLTFSGAYRNEYSAYVQIDWVGCLTLEPDEYSRVTYRSRKIEEIREELKRIDALWNSKTWRTVRSTFP
jgi:hypothetical protein